METDYQRIVCRRMYLRRPAAEDTAQPAMPSIWSA